MNSILNNKQTIIIFEGHDGSGKSNIAEALSKKLEIPIFKSNKEKIRWHDHAISLMYTVDGITELLEQTKYSIIFDRWHVSEYAYSKVFGRFTSIEKIFDIDKRLSKLNTLIIHCFKNEEAFKTDEHDIVKTNQYNEIIYNYRYFLEKSRCQILNINTTDEDLDKQIEKILSKIMEMNK